MAFKIGSSKSGPKTVPTPPSRPSFVLGSRPPDLRAPRIKPLSGQTQYGKIPPLQRNPGVSGFGQTGLTGES